MNDVKEGSKAPGFSAAVTDGTEVSLEALRGRPVVLYFYPKDDTPGCTREACAFRDLKKAFDDAGAAILGVSKDSVASHGKFTAKYGLTFPLVADPTGAILDAYGVWKQKTLYGRTALGVERSTFLIDRDGIVRKVWRGVKVDGHVDEVLAALKAL